MERQPRTRLERARPLAVIGLAVLVPFFVWLTGRTFDSDGSYLIMPPEMTTVAVVSALLALVTAAVLTLTAYLRRRWIEAALLSAALLVSPTFAFGLGFTGTSNLGTDVTAINGDRYRVLYRGFMDINKTLVRVESDYFLFEVVSPTGDTLYALDQPDCLDVDDSFETVGDDRYLMANADRSRVGMFFKRCPMMFVDVETGKVAPAPE